MSILVWVAVVLIGGAGSVLRFYVDGLVGSASGYLGNRTVVFLSYFGPTTVAVELNLTPLHLCVTDCQTANGTVPSTFRLIPPGNWGVALLTTAPLLLVVGALAYLAGTRRRLASAEKR